MSFFDLLLADALATGLARALAEDRPPPENFFVIPPETEVNEIVIICACC